MNTTSSAGGGKGGTIGIIVMLGGLIVHGGGAAVILARTMGKKNDRENTPLPETQPVVQNVKPFVEEPPPLPEETPTLEPEPEEPEPEEPEPEETKKPKKKKPLPVGTIDAKAAQAVTKKNYARVRSCYEKQLKVNNLLQGSITVKITVYPDGSVNAVKFTKDTIRNSTMNQCIKGEIKSWRFPKPEGGKVDIQQSYKFTPKTG